MSTVTMFIHSSHFKRRAANLNADHTALPLNSFEVIIVLAWRPQVLTLVCDFVSCSPTRNVFPIGLYNPQSNGKPDDDENSRRGCDYSD